MMLVLAQLTLEDTGTICTQQQASASPQQCKLHQAACHSQSTGIVKHRHTLVRSCRQGARQGQGPKLIKALKHPAWAEGAV